MRFCKRCNKLTKRTKSRSCFDCAEINSKKHRQRHWFRYLAQKANARKRPNSIKLTEEILVDQYIWQNKVCAISGLAFDINSKYYKPSLDRIDSTKGYTMQNIQLVLWIVNRMKSDLNQFEFKNICYQIGENYRLQFLSKGIIL